MSDDDTRHSGSRWEPTPASVPEKDVPAGDVPAKDSRPSTAGETTRRVHKAADDGPAAPPGLRRGRHDRMLAPPRPPPRRGLLRAAARRGCSRWAGPGGYAIGHAAAGSDPAGAAGLAGAPGEYGHHRGPFGADGGAPGDRDGDDGSAVRAAGGRQLPGAGTGSTGPTGTTGTST